MCVWLLNSFLLGSQFFLDHETFKNNEASENQVDVEVDELESDDGEEELDTWNGFGWWGWQYFVEFLFLYPFIIPILCYVLNVHRRKKICSKYLSIAMFFFIETCPYIVAALCVLYIHTCI